MASPGNAPDGKLKAGVTGNNLIRWRNRLLGSARFRSFVQRTPVLRRIARRNANQLFGMVSGFVNSQVLFACVRLGILEQLEESVRTSDELAALNSVPSGRMRVLMEAAKSLQLVQENKSGQFMIGPMGAVLASDQGLQAMIIHHEALYRDLADPVGLLRNDMAETELSRYWAYAGKDNAAEAEISQVRDYTNLMGQSQAMVSEQILGCWKPGKSQSLLDVGGGDGHFLEAVARRYPSLKLGLFDLPSVIRIATDRLGGLDLEHQISFHPGDFHHDDLPGHYNAISLVRILHDHDDDAALALLRKVRLALPVGGELLIAEPLKETRGSVQMGGAYFGLYLLAMGSGRPRSIREMTQLIRTAGFMKVKHFRTDLPLVCSVMTAA